MNHGWSLVKNQISLMQMNVIVDGKILKKEI